MIPRKNEKKLILPVLLVAAFLLFLIDLQVPKGFAVWILYVPLIIVSLYSPYRFAPWVMAGLGTILSLIGYFKTATAVSAQVSITNRSVGSVVYWTIAYLVWKIRASRQNLAKNAAELSEKAWVRQGQFTLSRMMAGDKKPTELAEAVLTYLAKNLDIPVAAFYGLDEQGFLHRLAGHALGDGTSARRFAVGEGLTGQAAFSQNALFVQEVPKGYFTVLSSLGEAPPPALSIIPIIHHGRSVAVLELASWQPLTEAQKSFIDQISESIASNLAAAYYRRQLEGLLQKMQQQAEELIQQQEELKSVNAELEEQTEELRQYQAHLEEQRDELKQANAELELQHQALEEQKEEVTTRNEELSRIQRQLLEKTEDLAATSRYKSEFLANMSHELRTPLNSLLILTNVLLSNKEKNLSDRQLEALATIESSGNDLHRLINDVLDLSKVEARQLVLHEDSVAMGDVASWVEKNFRHLNRKPGVKFRVVLDTEPGLSLRTDQQRLEQILRNFLSNALKFTEHGEVAFRIAPPETPTTLPSGAPAVVAIEVADTGIGIAPEQHAMIFEAFRQADGTTSRKYGGTGLGLSIVKELSRLLGGEVRLESALGRGSSFMLLLPERLPESSEALTSTPSETDLAEFQPRIENAGGKSARVALRHDFQDDRDLLRDNDLSLLIIEDDPNFSRILADIAREHGFRCLVAAAGQSGLEDARHYLPNAILLDMHLPDINGLQILERLKRDLKTRHIPVHVISGYDFSHSARKLGAIGYLTKPARPQALHESLTRIEGYLKQGVKRVLVVEDDDVQRKSICSLIQESDIECRAVSSARKAMELIAREAFDCMILDLMLPDMSGFEFLEKIHADGLSCPPVIVYTARLLTRGEEELLSRYSESIIIKGARSPERLLDEVVLFLHHVESKLPSGKREMLRGLIDRGQDFAGKRVLLVDDDARNLFALSSVLEDFGARPEYARNGIEALEKLEQFPDTDLVLMDIMMPEMDGYEAMRRIRENPAFKKLPILALTAKAMKGDYEKCLQAGANDYLAKPVDLDQLLSLLRIWLKPKDGF